MFVGYLDKYRKRLEASGIDEIDAYNQATSDFINEQFSNAPSYRKAKLNGVDLDIRVTFDSQATKDSLGSRKRNVLFRPNTNVSSGSILEFDDQKWLLFDVFKDQLAPRASAQLCNDNLQWAEKDGTIRSFPCVASSLNLIRYRIDNNKYGIDSLDNGLFVFVSMNPYTLSIVASQRFIFGNQVFEVSGLDESTFNGVIQIILRNSLKTEKDDLAGKIADNSAIYKKAQPHTGNVEMSNGGGDLW